MPYSLVTAAQAAGVNRSTILRAIKSGRISAAKDELTGAWVIEPSELHRIYPLVCAPDANQVAVPDRASPDILVAELRAQLTEMRAQRDAWQGIAERIALGHTQPAQPTLSWWRWLRSTG